MADQRSSGTRAWLAYTALRLLLFAAPFLVIWALSGNPTLSAVLAAVIGFALSIVLLDGQRSRVAGRIASRVERRRPASDEAAEDAADQPTSASDAASPKP